MNASGRIGTLSSRQRAAVRELVASPSVAEACQRAGIGRTTLYNWMHQPGFSAALRDAQSEVYRAALAGVAELANRALATVADLLSAKSESVKLSAARAVLETAAGHLEAAALAARLDEIERRLAPGGVA